MAPRGRPPSPRGVFSFESDTWHAPRSILVDTSVVVDALVPSAPSHPACAKLFEDLAAADATVVYNDLLKTELCEVLFRLALAERWGTRRGERARYDGRARRRAGRLLEAGLAAWSGILDAVDSFAVDHATVSGEVPKLMRSYGLGSYDAIHVATAGHMGVDDVATLDLGFASVPPSVLIVHTTRARASAMRQRR